MRSKWTTKRILIGKTYLDAAYRRIHANVTTALTCIAMLEELDFLCLRLPFGTTPAQAEYKTVSEAAIDLGNDLLQDEYWDIDDIKLSHSYLLPTGGETEVSKPSCNRRTLSSGQKIHRGIKGWIH